MATQNFINECKNMANANRLGKFDLQMYDRFEKEFKGDTFQQTYTGKNLMPNNKASGTSNGVTFTAQNDGTYLVNGKSNSTTQNSYLYIYNSSLNLEPGKYYYITTGDANCGITMYVTYEDNTKQYIDMYNGTSQTFNKKVVSAIIYLQVRKGTTTNYNNFKLYPMLSTTPITVNDYEPYVGGISSPNPDYPQEIQNVTGRQEVLIQNGILPLGYTQVDYIASSGTQYINLGVKLKKDQKVITDIEFTELENQTIFGTYGNTENFVNVFGLSGSNYFEYRAGSQQWKSSTTAPVINTKYNIEFNYGATSQYLKVDGTNTITGTQTLVNNTSTYNAYLFARRSNDGTPQAYSKIKLYSFKLYDGDNLKLDLIPCYRNSDNSIGLYDLVNNTFLSNSGTGAFTYGAVLGNTYEVNLVKENVFNFDNYVTKSANVEIVSQNEDTLVATVNQATTWQTIRYNINNLKKNTDYSFKFDFENTYTSELYKHTWISIKAEDNSNIYNEPYYKDDIIKFNTGNSTTIGFSFHVTINSPAVVNTITINNVKLQENIELNKIGDYQDSIKKSSGKNLFNKNNANKLDGYINSAGTITSEAANKTIYIPCKSSTTYTVSKIASTRFGIASYSTTPQIGSTTSNFTRDNSATHLTLTTGSSDTYLGVWYYNSNTDTLTEQQILDSIMINEGSTALPYEPYGKVWYVEKQTKRIILDGTNNVFVSKSNITANNMFVTDFIQDIVKPKNNGTVVRAYSNYFPVTYANDIYLNDKIGFGVRTDTKINFGFTLSSSINTLELANQWLSTHNTEIIYPLATPEITEITNEELIEQLEAIELLKGTNNITITSEDLPVIFDYSFWNGDTEIDEDDRFLEINQSNYLTSVELKDSCYVNDTIIGSTYTKNAEVELLNLPIDTKLVGKTIVPEIGVRYNDDTTEYETFDNYTIESVTDEQTASNTKFTAMNGGALLDKEYICSLSFENGQTHTINEFYQDACRQIGLTPTDSTFDNSELIMTGNPFTNKESIRTLISEVEKTSCTIINFDWNNKTASMTWLSNQIDYEFNTNDYSILEGSMTQYGPLNTIIIANTELNGENVVMVDEESVARDGEHQIVIDSPYFLYTEELRTQAIQAIYNKLVGLTYYDLKLTTPYGKPFIKIGNKIRINTNEGQTYDTYVLKHTITYNGAIQSIIESPALTSEEQTVKNNFKQNSIKERIKRTELIVDKTTGDITAITDRVTTVENEFGDVYSKEEVNTLIQNSATGLTNTFISSGGNNLLRNTGLWFEDRSTVDYLYPEGSLYPSDELFMKADPHWEYWKGNAEKVKEDKAANMSGILLKTGYFEQNQQVRNGTYTLSFKYRKLNQLANVNVQINNKRIELNNTEDTEIVEVGEITSQFVDLTIFSDTNDSCIIYDLMLNAGSEKAEYSQHQNETTTDTVNISKGITISSSDTNTTFKANSDGIRVYNSKDMDTPVVDFTDTGMNTNRVKVKEEAEIVKVLWKNVGNNTWITRL